MVDAHRIYVVVFASHDYNVMHFTQTWQQLYEDEIISPHIDKITRLEITQYCIIENKYFIIRIR